MIEIRFKKNPVSKKFRILLTDQHRYRLVYGGAGSGKSYSLTQCYIIRALKGRLALLVARNTGRSNRDSTFALFRQILSKWGLMNEVNINQADMRITFRNGSEVIFTGLDDVEKLKSITSSTGELTDIWVEEASEITEAAFDQLNVRLRGGKSKKSITLSFNPIDVNHWIKKRFVDIPNDEVLLHHSTYLDNPHIDNEYRKVLESYRETDPYMYRVYALGEWGVFGESIFSTEAIGRRLEEIKGISFERGWFELGCDLKSTWHANPQGNTKIFRRPEEGHMYVIGGDTASGVGSDFSICQVIDAKTGEQVAVMKDRLDSDLYARQCYSLAREYNNALVAIEVNFDSYPIKKLEDLGYTNMYVREQNDTFTGAIRKAYGFRTDSFTRPRILSQLVEMVREHTSMFNDVDTLNEMLTFVRNEKGRAEAQEGAHDDLVMAIAIAHECAKQVIFNDFSEERELTEEESFFEF